MEQSEKMVALKKAYAEIILNTAKEAAARVMVAERKALRSQQDLSGTKEEALRLLVRLKQMIDAKIIEGEIISLNQQKRIDELEAQLHEAEDIITDLRTELRWARDKLEKVKHDQPQPLNVKDAKGNTFLYQNATPASVIPSHPNLGLVTPAASDMGDTLPHQSPLDNKFFNMTKQTEQLGVPHLERYYAHNSDLASLIMTNKEPELYRNGCTQRIRALEQNLQDGELPPGHADDQSSLRKNELIIETSAKDDRKCTASSLKAKKTDMKNFSGKTVRKTSKVRTLRRRKRRFGKAKVTSYKSRDCQLKKPCQSSSVLSHCKSYLVNGNVRPEEGSHTQPSKKTENMDMVKSFDGLEEQLQQRSSFYSDQIAIICKRKRNRKVKVRDGIASSFISSNQLAEPCQQSTVLTCCRTFTNSFSVNVKSGDQVELAKNEAKTKPLPHLDPGFTSIKSNVDPILGAMNVTLSMKAQNRSRSLENVADKDAELTDDSALAKQGSGAAEKSNLPSSVMSSGMINVPPIYSNLKDAEASEEANGSPSKADSKRLLKYTFKRKRKKESFSDPDENKSPEKSTMKGIADEKQYCMQEPDKSGLANESSRDSQGLAQVAHQLISLSGKRWL